MLFSCKTEWYVHTSFDDFKGNAVFYNFFPENGTYIQAQDGTTIAIML